MSVMTPTQADGLLELVNRATGRRYRSLGQAARHFGMSGGAVARITGSQAETLIDEWATRPEFAQPWIAEPANGEGAMTAEQAASVLGHELFITTVTAPDGITFIPDAVELLDDGGLALRGRVALADVTSWSTL